MMAKFPGGELIVTYAMDPDTQQNPLFLSDVKTSRDAGQHWSTRYGTMMQHIPMIFVPEARNSLMAIPSELLGDKEGDHPSFRAPYLRFEEGGKRIVMEPDGVHVLDWPWPVEVHRNTQPPSNWPSRVPGWRAHLALLLDASYRRRRLAAGELDREGL